MARIVPSTRKGPNGIALFFVTFFCIRRIMPTTEPKKYAVINASNPNFQPRMIPMRAPSRKSPPPIHFPFEIINCSAKNPKMQAPPISIESGDTN